MALHQRVLRFGAGGRQHVDALAALIGAVGQVHEPVVVAAGVEDDPLAQHVGVPLDLAVEVPAQLHHAQGLEAGMPHRPELHVGGLELARVRHDLHPTALEIDGHEAVVGVAELLVRHGHGGAVGLEVVDGVVSAGHDPADVVDARAVLGEPVALVLELVGRRLQLHLERGAAGQEGVVHAPLAGVVQVRDPLPVVGRYGVVPAQPVPHGVAGLLLEDAQVVKLVCRRGHGLLRADRVHGPGIGATIGAKRRRGERRAPRPGAAPIMGEVSGMVQGHPRLGDRTPLVTMES